MSTVTVTVNKSLPIASRLSEVLFGQIRGRIMTLLFGHPGQQFYLRQIARMVDTSPGNVQRELETLSDIHLIIRLHTGRQVFAQANQLHPIFAELRSLIAKTSGIYQQLGSALQPLAPRIAFAFVYGSVARGEEDAHSDVDLMVIGKVTLDEVLAQLGPAERDIDRSINPTVYTLGEFKTKLRAGNHFLTAIVRGKTVFLVGDENEFRKMGRIRLATEGTVEPG